MPFETLFTCDILQTIGQWFISYSWVWLFIVLFFTTRSVWLAYRQEHFKLNEPDWKMFEIRVPRELRKSPKAMEQIFMSIHAWRNSPSDFNDKWLIGETTLWFSFEIVSLGGELHYFIRLPNKYKNLLESAFYAQYPDIEIAEIKEDYIHRMPPTIDELHERGYELFGSELKLARHDAYPIRTYIDFEAIEEERQLDPISALLEVLAKAKPQEHVWIQVLIKSDDDEWQKEGEKLVKQLKEKAGKREIQTPTGTFVLVERSPGELDTMKAVDRNLSKAGFETLIRYIYISPKEIYNDGFARRGIFSAFNQYASESLNKFKQNMNVWTRIKVWQWPHVFPHRRLYARQKRVYARFRAREMHDETVTGMLMKWRFFDWNVRGQIKGKIVLNVEELATI